MAILDTIGMPLLIPPIIPPELFVFVVILPSSIWYSSLISEPLHSATPKPRPISTPFTAPMFIRMRARSPSSLSKTGSPNPAGTPTAIVSTIPPTESPSSFLERITSSISTAAFKSPHLTGFFSIFSLIFEKSFTSALTSPI